MKTQPPSLPVGRRVRIHQLAESPMEGIERFAVLEDQPPPDPGTLKPTDVIVAVKSASVGWVDLLMTSGQYQHQPPLPYTPGLEYSGVIAWAGGEVDPAQMKVGDAVHSDGLEVGPRSPGDYQSYGGFASYAVAPASAMRPIPKGLDFDQACNLLGNYETAWHCLVACGNLQAGETVLIHGASGSTGLAAVHIARILGATVIATGRSEEKLRQVREQGADHTINCRPEEGQEGVRRFRDEVKALTGGQGVQVVYDGVGGDISLESLRCVDFGARYLIVGWAATPFVAKGKGQRGAPNANMLPTNLIMMKGLKVLGCPTVISTLRNPSIRAQRLEQIMAWVNEGRLKPHVSDVFPLDQYREAMMAKWTGKVIGGCVIRP